jgi:hypothetical protein
MRGRTCSQAVPTHWPSSRTSRAKNSWEFPPNAPKARGRVARIPLPSPLWQRRRSGSKSTALQPIADRSGEHRDLRGRWRRVGWDGLLNRLTYYRLGPAPAIPTTELLSEGWSDDLYLTVRLSVPQPEWTPVRVGPPWMTDASIALTCDVVPESSCMHVMAEWPGQPVDTPVDAAIGLRAAVAWGVSRG